MLTAMTFPGQTAGLSPFTDPLIESLDIDRTAISFSYLLATLTGALTMPILGRLLDKYGAKRAIIVIGFLLMTVVFLASFITDIIGLTTPYNILSNAGAEAKPLADWIKTNYIDKGKLGVATGEGFYSYDTSK